MRLSEFIASHQEEIATDWEAFAATIKPGGPLALRDHITALLEAIAADIATSQSEADRFEKSMGRRDDAGDVALRASHRHAVDRVVQQYAVEELVSEFRALRASVTRRWTAYVSGRLLQRDVEDVVRFNESIDQLLAESIAQFSRDVQTARDLFLATLGHDLRSPLGAITNYARALVDLPAQPSLERLHAVGRGILTSAECIGSLGNGLLDLARTRFGRTLPINPSRMNLAELCDEVVNEICVADPDVEVLLCCPGDVSGNWDRLRLSQVLTNLLRNAIAFGDMSAPISLTVHEDTSEVTIAVHNEGRPFNDDLRSTMFKPYVRGRERRNCTGEAPGFGLGLYIASQIVQAHGGSIAVQSAESQGTTFFVRLPSRIPE